MSRNYAVPGHLGPVDVTSREGRVSRNVNGSAVPRRAHVTSREGRVSRNTVSGRKPIPAQSHVPRGACE